jgi:hypothetical protein
MPLKWRIDILETKFDVVNAPPLTGCIDYVELRFQNVVFFITTGRDGRDLWLL